MSKIAFESSDEALLWVQAYTTTLKHSLMLPAGLYGAVADQAVRDFRARYAIDEPVRPNETMQGPSNPPVKES